MALSDKKRLVDPAIKKITLLFSNALFIQGLRGIEYSPPMWEIPNSRRPASQSITKKILRDSLDVAKHTLDIFWN